MIIWISSKVYWIKISIIDYFIIEDVTKVNIIDSWTVKYEKINI